MLRKIFPTRDDIYEAYLTDLLNKTAFSGQRALWKEERNRVAHAVREIINTDEQQILYYHGNEALFDRVYQCLIPYAPNVLITLFDYEALYYNGPTYFDPPFLALLCARIIERSGSRAYHVVEKAAQNGFQQVSWKYIQRLGMGQGLVESKQTRHRLLIYWTLRKLIHLAPEHIPHLDANTSNWAMRLLGSPQLQGLENL